jgi:hypothetical protein
MLANLAINAVFAARGRPASYTPPRDGAAIPCVVIYDAGDREAAVLGDGFSVGARKIPAGIAAARGSRFPAPQPLWCGPCPCAQHPTLGGVLT